MPLFVYRCNVCGCTDEKFLPVERREEQFDCSCKLVNCQFDYFMKTGETDLVKCPGKMIFQPMQKTSFYFKEK